MSAFKCLFLDKLNCSAGRIFRSSLNNQTFLSLEIVKSESNLELLTEEVQIEFEIQDCAQLRSISQWLPDVTIDYILYHYVEGDTLAAVLKKQPPQSEEQIVFWIQDILCALQKLHSKALMGRCFNTESVKVQKTSNRLVMFDFGFFPKLIRPNQRCISAPEVVLQCLASWSFILRTDHVNGKQFSVNFQPITQIKGDKISDYQNYLKGLQQQKNGIQIPGQFKNAYSIPLIALVESMLLFDPNQRISFEKIVQSPIFQEQFPANFNNFYESQFPLILQEINGKIKNYDQCQKEMIIRNIGKISVDLLPTNQQLKQSVEMLQEQETQKIFPQSKESVNIYYSQLKQTQGQSFGQTIRQDQMNNQLQSQQRSSQKLQPDAIQQQYGIYSQVNEIDQFQSNFAPPPLINIKMLDTNALKFQDIRYQTILKFEITIPSQNQFKDISDRLALDLYRLNFMRNFLIDLPNFCFQDVIKDLIIYFVTKAKIIYLRELLKNLQKKSSPDYVTKQSQVLEQQVAEKIASETKLLKTKYFPNAFARNTILHQNYQFAPVLKSITENVTETSFDPDIKVPYRITMLSLYRLLLVELESNNSIKDQLRHSFYQFTIKTLFCHLINRIFDPSLMTNHFQYLAQMLELQNVVSFEPIELFLQHSSALELVNQMNQILKIYFT